MLPARLRSSVPFHVPQHLQSTSPLSPLPRGNTQNVPSLAQSELMGKPRRDSTSANTRSISIGRTRRKHQRLPSSLLIENVAASALRLRPTISAAKFPMKASDFWTAKQTTSADRPLFDQVNSRRAESAQTPVGTPTCRDENILFFGKGGSRVRYHGPRLRASCNFLLANAAG